MGTNAPRERKIRVAIALIAACAIAAILIHPHINLLLAKITGQATQIAEASSGGTLTYHQVTLEQDGEGSVLIMPPGTTIAMPGNYTFVNGSTVTLQAIPATDYEFDHWEGAISGTENPKLVTVNSAFSIRPVFLPIVRFSAATSGLSEAIGTTQVTLTRRPALRVSTLNYTVTGTATSGTDFTALSGQVTFPTLSTSQTINVPITSDLIDEDNETIILTLSSATNAKIGSPSVHTLTINDDDALPTIQIQGSNLSPTEGGTQPTLQVYLSPTSGRQVTVPFTLSASPPTAGSDYTLTPAQVVIPAGQGSAASPISVPITIIDDNIYEGSAESLTVSISSPTNATIGSPYQRTINIADNDILLTLNISGSGTVSRSPAATNTLSGTQFVYTAGTAVAFTATPTAGSGHAFRRWEQALTGSTNPQSLTLNANKTVDAIFQLQHTLTTGTDPASSGTGTVTPATGLQWANENATVTATAAANSRFKQWTNDLSGSTSPAQIMMNAPKTVKAEFVKRYQLTTSVDGTGSIATAFQGPPEAGPGPWYDAGTVVTLTASLPNPVNGWRFKGWKVGTNIVSTSLATNVTMDADKTYTAVFEQWFTLTTQVADPTWAGSISVDIPSGAGSGPTYQFPANTNIRVRATRIGSRLDRWTINCLPQGNNEYMDFNLYTDITVIAYFVPQTFVSVGSETLDSQGQVIPNDLGGSVWPTGGDTDIGETLNFTYSTFPDHRFLQWSGDVSGTSSPVPLVVNGPKTVRAQFIRTFWIDGYIAPANAGTMTCTLLTGHNNTGHYDDGSTVQLQATPVQGQAFDHWEIEIPYSGNPPITVEDNPTTITMDTHKRVTAHFAEARTLTVVVEPAGAGTVTPNSGEYPVDSTQTLVAAPNADYLFSYWAGDIEVGANTDANAIDITMDGDKQIIARFVQRPGIGDVDMLSDFATFLTTIGASESIETFDMNECDYDENAERIYVGNGIPDAVELLLVETILNSPRLDLSAQSGVVQGVIWAAWLQNLQQATLDLENASLPPTADLAALARVIAGYATLGDYFSHGTVEHLLQSVFPNFVLNEANYKNGGMPHLPYRKDADNDGKTNLMEWNALSGTEWPERVESYIQQALGQTPNTITSPPPSPNSLGSIPECIPTATVTEDARDAHSANPPGDSVAEVLRFDPQIPLGTEVFVLATPDEEQGWHFKEWQAPTINGSREVIDRFSLDGPADVTGVFDRFKVMIRENQYLLSASVEVTPSDGAIELGSENGYRVFAGPPGSSVILKATSTDPDLPHFGTWSGERRPSPSTYIPIESKENPVRIPLVPENWNTYIYGPGFWPNPPNPELFRVTVPKMEGGRVLCGTYHYTQNGYAFADSISAQLGIGVLFKATPSPGYEFEAWDFPFNEHVWDYLPGHILFTHYANIKEVKAKFRRIETYELDLHVNDIDGYPAGFIRTNNPPTNKYLLKDAEVIVESLPHPGFAFVRWDGNARDLEGELVTNIYDNPVHIRMRDNYQLHAIFEPVIDELYQAERQILETSSDTNEDGIPDDVAIISAAPSMPKLTIIVPGLHASVEFPWRLTINYTRSGRNDSDTIPEIGPGMTHSGEEIDLPSWCGDQIYGGDAILYYSPCGEETPREFNFRIRAMNPEDSTAIAYINGHANSTWYARYIGKHESYEGSAPSTPADLRFYNQFEEGPVSDTGWNTLKTPYAAENGDGGFGLFQLTRFDVVPPTNPPSTRGPNRQEIWSWHANVDTALDVLSRKITTANAHMNIQRQEVNSDFVAGHIPAGAVPVPVERQGTAQDPSNDHDPQASNENLTALVTFQDGTARTIEHAVAMKAYNGASGGHYCVYNPWQSAENPGGWRFNRKNTYEDPFNYVNKICYATQ